MNSCVNTRSKEFKNLCSKYNVSSEKMELLIHQYWNERNSDTEYPSNAYIEAHLGKSPYQESIDSVVKIWEKDYSKSKIFNSDKELKEAQNKAARFFPSEAIVSYTNNQGKYVLTIRKPVKNIKEAYRKAIENGSWNNDKKTNNNQDIEDIQMYISSNEDKSSNKTYFTFKDGTQVKAPFVVNVQQEAALNDLDNFVKSNANVITLSGYAGTGKTSIMQIFKEKMDKEGVPVTFTAATNKAANVLKTKVKDAQTLHSAFGIQAGVDYNSEYDLKHLINTVKENNLLPGSVVVIDEASMIDDNIYKILNKIALDQNLKIIYLGDKAQLAPVNSAQISPIFRNKEGKVLELTKVERTGDNAILKEATGLRTKGVFSYVSSFNKDGKGVAFINSSKNRKEIENIIKAFTAKIQNDPDYFRILAYRNNTISKYNDYVRKILGYDVKNNPNDYYPHENEPIVGYNNWGYLKTRKGHTYRFINSESYKTIDATAPITNIELSVPNGKVYTITAKPVIIQKTDGTEDTLNFIDVRGNQDNRKAVTEIANVISYLWRKRKTVPFSEQSKILQEINKLQTALFVNDNIEENGRTIVQKIWDFGYAMTVHKSQGSTFKNVIIDDKDIQLARKNSEGIEYVDLDDSQEETVSKDQMDAILSSQEESIDSDITAAILTDQGEEVSSMPTKVKETKEVDINDTMDTVRQLEYVAVSRATDTATVITDMAKVEDSPLNHETNQFSKTDEHKSSVNPKDNTTNPVIQRSDNEITKQVVGHLKSIPGIKVFSRNAMEEFLKTHNIAGLQQMIDNNSQINKKDYNDEEQNIIDEAKKNGTFMKAPNGKPTNLTERQWVQVRTKAFKEWFGDWERVANSSKFNKRDHVSNSITSATYQGVYVSNVKFDPDMAPDGGTRIIFLGDKYIGEIPVVESKDRIRMSGSIGTATEIEEEYRGKGYGKKAHLALANIAKSEGKTLYSDSSNSDAEDALWKSLVKDGIAEVVSESPKDEHWNHTTYRIINDKLPQADDINSGDRGVSKVVDENGEPLVVYHYTDNKGLTKFSTEFDNYFSKTGGTKKAIFFTTDNVEPGSEDNFLTSRKAKLSLFLNIKNLETFNGTKDDLHKQGTSYREVVNKSSEREGSENGIVFTGFDDNRKENQTIYIVHNSNQIKSAIDNVGTFSRTDDNITTFTTPQGEVYGFVDKDGNIYLDETNISPEHPIHEYTHLWDRVVNKHNPQLWNRGVEIMKETDIWKKIANDEHYGKRWKAMNLNENRLESLIASEVHARFVGERGAQLLDKLAKEKGQENIISKLKQWIKDMWKDLMATFGSWSKEDINALTLDDFIHMTVRDFVDGVNLKEVTDASYTKQQSNVLKTVNDVWRYLGGYFEGAGLSINKDFPNASEKDISILEDNYMDTDRYPLSDNQIIEIGNRIVNSNNVKSNTTLNFQPKEAEFYSGAAVGSDKAWEEAATKVGIKVTNYTVENWDNLSNEWKERLDKEYQEIVTILGRRVLNINSYAGKLVRRDMMQADKADAIFAIGTLASNGYVDGGTGYASTRGILRNIPVYLFDQKDRTWKVWDKTAKKFVPTSQPALTKNAAVIGTRELQENGKKAINDIFTVHTSQYQTASIEKQSIIDNSSMKSAGISESSQVIPADNNQEQTLSPEEQRQTYAKDIMYALDHATFSVTLANRSKDDGEPIVQEYHSIVQYFMSQKAYLAKDYDSAAKIEQAKDDTEAVKIGSKVKGITSEEWAKLSRSVMKNGLKIMFEQNPSVMKKLLYSDTETFSMIQREAGFDRGFDKILGDVKQEFSEKYKGKTWHDESNSSQIDLNGKTQMKLKVNLPGYSHYELGEEIGKQTPIEINALWKETVLRNLDSQLVLYDDDIDEMLMSREEKAKVRSIIIQISAIFKMKNENDYTDTKKREKLIKKEEALFREREIDNQIDNLINQNDDYYEDDDEFKNYFPPSKVQETAYNIMDAVSSIISAIQANNDDARKLFPNVKAVTDNTDFTKLSRKEIIDAIGIKNITDFLYNVVEKTDCGNDDYKDTVRCMLLDNWDGLLRIGQTQLEFNEGIKIIENYNTGTFDTVQDNNPSVSDDSDDIQSNEDEDSLNEKYGDAQEAWQVDYRTQSVQRSMTTLVKSTIHDCYQLDKDGKRIYNPYLNTIALKVDANDASKQISYWTKGATNYEDMVSKLTKMSRKKKNLWLKQLLVKLNDTTGKYTMFQSQFFSTFMKSRASYAVSAKVKGKVSNIQANNDLVLRSMMNMASAKYTIKQYPLFDLKGIRWNLVGNNGTVDSNTFNLYKARKELFQILIDHGVGEKRVSTVKLSNNKEWEHDNYVVFKDGRNSTPFSEDDFTKMSKTLSKVFQVLGFDIDSDTIEESINENSILDIAESLNGILLRFDELSLETPERWKKYNPFDFHDSYSIVSYLRKMVSNAIATIEETSSNTVFNNGKTYQEYVNPSFLSILMTKLGSDNQDIVRKALIDNYSWSQWFCSGIETDTYDGSEDPIFRNPLLRTLYEHGGLDKGHGGVPFNHRVNLSFNDHVYMRNMNCSEYAISVFTQYWSSSDKNAAYYRIPMQSNKPTEDYIGTYCYRDDFYKNYIKDDLYDMFLMELSRIQTVRRRNLSKGDKGYIKNFDERGRKFCFFPFLNAYLDNDNLSGRNLLHNDKDSSVNNNTVYANLLQRKIDGIEDKKLSAEEEIALKKFTKEAMESHINEMVDSNLREWKENGILKAARDVNNIVDPYLKGSIENPFDKEKQPEKYAEREKKIDATISEKLENFIWNDYCMSKNILMLTIGDIAFYKDTEDMQKRLAQLHAPGIRARITATDFGDGTEGSAKRVSDGTYRTIVLKDWDKYSSDIKDNLKEVLQRKVEEAPENMKPQYKAIMDNILHAYSEINVADAEGYTCPTAYRKKALMFGKWSEEDEKVYQALLKGNADMEQIRQAFQPLKPFVYSNQLRKDMGIDTAPIQTMACPFQAKNSEYLLIMADALLRNEETSRPNILKALTDIMEDSAFDGRERDANGTITKQGTYNGKGIDTIQFESAIKSSLQGAIDISKFADNVEKGQQNAYDAIKKVIYKEGTNEYDTDNYVQEVPFENFCLQQEVPDHFIDHEQAHGSQIRATIPSDLEEYYDPNKDHDDVNNIVKYEWIEWQEVPSKNNPNKLEWKKVKVSLTASQFRKEYEKTISDKIEDSISKLKREFKIDSENLEESNIALSKILKREILGSPRYGLDMLTACSVDKTTGKFKIPLGDPIQCKRFEQLINSIIKNRINKQTIPGGPIVQVSNFGTSKQLHIRFNDKNGNLIPLKEEYKAEEHNGKSYEQYLRENQGGIAYFEVFAPIWSQELVEKFGDDKGNIDIKVLNRVAPELLRLISYRIPTEDKYSMAPCKIVGFLPRMAGSTIMLPYELTTQDGSDFDIDKRYVMRKSLRIVENKKKVQKYLKDEFVKKFPEKTGVIDDIINNFFNADPDKYNETDLEVKKIYDALHENKKEMMKMYTTALPSKDEFYNNRIIDMSWAVLTNPTQVEKVLNPGGFDDQKKVGYMIEAYKNTSLSWNELKKVGNSEKGIEKLKKLSYREKDIADFSTQLQFYRQNQAAGNLIGVFAVSKVSHAILGSDNIYIRLEDILGKGKRRFSIDGNEFMDYVLLDPEYDSNGNPIGKTLGSLVGASADAAKDPILNLMNINMTTCNVLNAMLRIGIPFETAALFLSQNVISDILAETEKRNLSSYTNIMSVINEELTKMSKEDGFQSISNINDEELTMDELIEGVKVNHAETKYKVLLMFQRLNAIAEALRAPTLLTRFNSISSAVGPLAIDNLMVEYKVNKAADVKSSPLYFKDNKEGEFNKIGAIDILAKHPILSSFYKAYGIASRMFSQTPGGSLALQALLDEMNPNMRSTVMGDRKLLDKLCTFLITYKAIHEGLVDESKLSYYINEFPKEVDKVKENKDYKDNAFIKAVIVDTDRATNKPYLKCNLTGIDNTTREKLSIGWLELYLKNPNLAKKFFDYSLFRGGLTFSPITFMALLPNQIKEKLKAIKPDGSTVSYLDIFDTAYVTNLDYSKIIDQFVRNNCDSYKLVPTIKLTRTMSINYNTKTLVVSAQDDMANVFGKSYIKTYSKNESHIWKLSDSNEKNIIYHEIDALGNEGEYLEMSKNDIMESLATKEHNKEVKAKKNDEIDANDFIIDDTLNTSFCFDIGNDTQEEDSSIKDSYENQEALAQEAADLLIHDKKGNMHNDKKVTNEENKDKRAILNKLSQVLKNKNIHLNEEIVKKEDKKLC